MTNQMTASQYPTSRRQFIGYMGAFAAASVVGFPKTSKAAEVFNLPPLPYADSALEPFISTKTIGFHHGKHHQGAVNKVNALIEGTRYAKMDLAQIIRATARRRSKQLIYNSASQAWNHDFYWKSMRPDGGGVPTGELLERIESNFGDFETFKQQFMELASKHFGSGWAWLALHRNGKLILLTTRNAGNPMTRRMTPLLTIDLFEHSYYLDYQNRRADHIRAIFENIINWEFAEENFIAACSRSRRCTRR